jgi:flavin reductase (DIM6/NTAB) family NADH-FMN oxidoreductase RutF
MQLQTEYDIAIRKKYPEQVVIAVAKDALGKCNPITLGWTMITSRVPPMMAISVAHTRHSLGAIRGAGEFVVAFPSMAMEKEVAFFGSKSGRDTDKLAECGTAVEEATAIDGVLLSDAVANFELRLKGEMETGDHVIFAGAVVAAHVNQDESVERLYNIGDFTYAALRPA